MVKIVARVSVRRPYLFLLLSWLGLRRLRMRWCVKTSIERVPLPD
jgi:hypothetical protein